MKKILSILLSTTLLFTVNYTLTFAENNTEIVGLHEKLSALFLVNNFTQQQIDEMDRQYINDFNSTWEDMLKGYHATGKMKTDSDKEEYIYRLNEAQLNYNNGILASMINGVKYAEQYAKEKKLNYLFDKNQFWNVPNKNDKIKSSGSFLINGNYANPNYMISTYKNKWKSPTLSIEASDFLRNKRQLSNMLYDNGETFIKEIRIIKIIVPALYVRCNSNEYMVLLYKNNTTNEEIIKGITPFKLYTAETVMTALENQAIANSETYLTPTKPIYETEALLLQAEGLLNGNENGLDLLKPLTRAEAAAILIRAMGETEEAPDNSVQTFSDVPKTFWGYGATEKAYSLGIVAGIGDNLFAPDEDVTAEQFSTMALRAANEHDFDWEQAVNILIEKGVLTQEQTKTMDFFTRGDMAKIIYEARQNGLF